MGANRYFICHDCQTIYKLGKDGWSTTEKECSLLKRLHKSHKSQESIDVDFSESEYKDYFPNYKYEITETGKLY